MTVVESSMGIEDIMLEIASLRRDLEDLVREYTGLSLEVFLEPDVSREYFEEAVKRVAEGLGLERQGLERSGRASRILSLHIELMLLNTLEDNSLREKVIEHEIEEWVASIERVPDERQRQRLLVELANRLGLEVRLVETPHVVYVSCDKYGRTESIVYEVETDLYRFIRLLVENRLYSEEYSLARLPVIRGRVLLPIRGEDTVSLQNIIKDLLRSILKTLYKKYSLYIETPVVREYSEKLRDLEKRARTRETDLYRKNLERVIEKIRSLGVRGDISLFPKCISYILERLRRGEEVSGDELYLLSVFLAYTNTEPEALLHGSRYETLLKILVDRVRDLEREGRYLVIPSCRYIKKTMGIPDDECRYSSPLRAYLHRLLSYK